MQESVNKEVHTCQCCEDIKRVAQLFEKVVSPILPLIQGDTNPSNLAFKMPVIIKKVSKEVKKRDVLELLSILSKYENPKS